MRLLYAFNVIIYELRNVLALLDPYWFKFTRLLVHSICLNETCVIENLDVTYCVVRIRRNIGFSRQVNLCIETCGCYYPVI